jgi:DNA-binding CsgD family transcriptional regulator
VADPALDLIGRTAERAELEAFTDALASRPTALSLDGDPGAGKTTLWLAALALARERGCRTVATRPVAAEASLAFAGLGDLLGGVLDEVLDVLPEPQSEALRVALLLERPRAPLDERAVGVSVLSALRALGATRPIVLAVDDVQWLDAATAAVLTFAWRRLSTEPVGLLLARRDNEPAPRALEGLDPLRHVAVGPLSADDLHLLLRHRLGVVFARPALRRVHAVSGGNPFFALEIGRAFDRQRAMLAAGHVPPLPDRLLELVADRIAALPDATQEALAAIAALSHPTPALVSALADGDEAIRPAFAAHLLELDGDRLRFSHPLLAAAAYEAVDPLRRRVLHRRLAAVVADEDERVRLLALASAAPDEEVAGTLEDAAVRALDRGASAVAAELSEQALRLTPRDPSAERDRRAIRAAGFHWAAGDPERARLVLEDAVDSASCRRARAEALTELAWVHVMQADQPGGAALARRALADMDADAAVRPHALNCLATALVFMLEDLRESARVSAEAVELARLLGNVVALSENLCSLGYVVALLGRRAADDLLREAAELGAAAWGWRVVGWPGIHAAGLARWADRLEDAIAAYHAVHTEALHRGDHGSVPMILGHLALAELAAGRWPDAEATATRCCELAAQGGDPPNEAMALSARAMVRATTGRSAEARADASHALAITGERSVAEARIHALWALALLDLGDDRPGDAADRLGPLRAKLAGAGVGEPGAMRFVADEIEALVAAGRLADAEAVVDWLEELGRALDRASALAAAERGRGLLAAATGAPDAAIAAYRRAVEQHARIAVPFERARTLLHLGAAQRRAKHRREARATLNEALRVFDALGAAPWSRRAGEELARISGRRPGGSELTATERRIAELVSEGRTNKEVAAALFLSPRTVESCLSQIFRKLGVRSRTELARLAKVQGFPRFGPSDPEVASLRHLDLP